MDALPEIVDGARKISQGGRLVGAPGRNSRFSSLPMIEVITSRNQCMSALPEYSGYCTKYRYSTDCNNVCTVQVHSACAYLYSTPGLPVSRYRYKKIASI